MTKKQMIYSVKVIETKKISVKSIKNPRIPIFLCAGYTVILRM